MASTNTSILKAVMVIYNMLGKSEADILNDIQLGYLTENDGRSNRTILWYMDDTDSAAIYVDTLEALTEQEIDSELC